MQRKAVVMCRWLAYAGTPIRMEELLVKRERSLIDQSLHSQLGATTTNGDGFGVGWYGEVDTPLVYHSTHPAWNDRNLLELAAGVRSRLFFAHIRASTGSAIQQTNTHPFRYGRWLWMHNGLIRGFAQLKRDLVLAVSDSLYPHIEGTTDSELMFYLALTFGLEDDPINAVARMVGLVEETAKAHQIENPMQMTVATTDGVRVWAFRYSTEGKSRSLFYSTEMSALRSLYPESPELAALSEDTRAIVSEPLGDLPGAWHAVPESHCGVVGPEEAWMREFEPQR
jgi:predicted glutamine amidotransferase